MAATFDPGLATVKDRMRLQLGDTKVASALLQDETYTGLIAHHGNNEAKALAAAAEALLALYAQKPDKVEELEWRSRVPVWREIVARARANAGSPPALSVRLLERAELSGSEYRADSRPPW